MFNILGSYRAYRKQQTYNTFSRTPFFDLAIKHIPEGKDVRILDIGAGNGAFADYLSPALRGRYLYLLDGNPESVEKLKKKYSDVVLHKIPGSLPFDERFFDFIHCSHVVEHLEYGACYSFIKEIDRILKPGGILVISTPTFHPDFYNDFSHIKPYHPSVFLKYLVDGVSASATAPLIAENYKKLELVFRYTLSTPSVFAGSENKMLDYLFYVGRQIKNMLGIKVYQRSGYTLVLQKG